MEKSQCKSTVGELRKEQAKSNIEIKIDIMRSFINKGIPWQRDENDVFNRDNNTGSRILDFYPTSENEFAKWTTKKPGTKFCNCTATLSYFSDEDIYFISHGQDTLKTKNNISLRTKANSLFETLKVKAKQQLNEEKPSSNIAFLKEEVKYWKQVAEVESQFVLDSLAERNKDKKRIKELERSLAEAKSAMEVLIQTKNSDIASKDAEKSLLKKQLKEIQTFKKVPN